MKKIPFLSVSGSHFDCGFQIGAYFTDIIHSYIKLCHEDSTLSISWRDCLDATPKYLAPTQKYFPEVIEEMNGVAKGARVDPIELFATGIEEFSSDFFHTKACTDIIYLPPASNHTLVTHNNDLNPDMVDFLTQVEWNFADGTAMYTIGSLGYGVSSGINSSGLVLSGNELAPNDVKIGIPRGYIARAILSAKDINSAIAITTNKDRASSYNNIISVRGKSVSVEASATDYDLLYPENGILVHSNDFVSPKMTKFEGQPNYTTSIERRRRGIELATLAPKPIDLTLAKTFLSDHGDNNIRGNDTICRHGPFPTLNAFVVDLDDGIVEITHGSPCENKFEKVWQLDQTSK